MVARFDIPKPYFHSGKNIGTVYNPIINDNCTVCLQCLIQRQCPNYQILRLIEKEKRKNQIVYTTRKLRYTLQVSNTKPYRQNTRQNIKETGTKTLSSINSWEKINW